MVMIDKASKLLRPFAFGALASILFAATAPAQAQTETKALEQAAKTWVKSAHQIPKARKTFA